MDVIEPAELILAPEPVFVKESATGRLKPIYPRLDPLDRIQQTQVLLCLKVAITKIIIFTVQC